MLKKFKYIIFALAISLVLPNYAFVFAGSDGVGEGVGTDTISGSCKDYDNCYYEDAAGVRITFVDQTGTPVSGSYDFSTRANNSNDFKGMVYNSGTGNKSKLSGSFNEGTIDITLLPRLSDLANRVNNFIKNDPNYRSGNVASINLSGNTGGFRGNHFAVEETWFKSFTTSGLSRETYTANVNALVQSIGQIYSSFNASEMMLKLTTGCETGQEIYIQMEPLYTVARRNKKIIFGSVRDILSYYSDSSMKKYMNDKGFLWTMYYNREIKSGKFSGFSSVALNGYKLQSPADINASVGYAVALDWANSPEGYCNKCQIIGDEYFCKDGNKCSESQYKSECSTVSECCTDEPITPGKIEGAVANCCVETTHSYAKEYDLDELFCYHNDLKVDKYWAKCNAEQYKTEINEYCDMYCTERVTIDVPDAITAKSGRYFTLSKNPVGNTTSPYIEGYKRCRMVIKYDQWEKDYIEAVKKQINTFNEYQKKAAELDNYNKLLADDNLGSKKDTVEVNCSASASLDVSKLITNDAQRVTNETNCRNDGGLFREESDGKYYCNKTVTTNVGTCEITYNTLKNTFASKSYLEVTQSNSSIVGNGTKTVSLHETNSNLNIDTRDCENKKRDNERALTTIKILGHDVNASYSCNYTNTVSDNGLKERQQAAQNAASQEKESLASAINEAQTLKGKLNQCNNYFAETKETGYQFNPAMTFRYSQIYRDDNGKSLLSEIDIPFMETPGCKLVSLDEGQNITYENGTDTRVDGYSSKYQGELTIKDFTNGYSISNSPVTSISLQPFNVNRRFTHDARYKVVCEWEEKPNTVNTLVPNGAVTDSATANFTVHEREYKVFLTTYDGTYETDWSITNVGEKGKFDKFLQNNGTKTCSDNKANSDDTFSCTLHIEYEIVYTGKCNGITKNPDDCDPVKDVTGLFQFKVADPTNIFPTGTTTVDGKEVAKNWTNTSKGIAVREKIEEIGAQGATYDEARATYKFHLKPADMRHIKNYNVTRNSNQRGGYSDFEMNCDCPVEAQTNTAISGGVGCTKCKSILLDELVNGRIKYDGQTHQINVWTATNSIDQVRNATWR